MTRFEFGHEAETSIVVHDEAAPTLPDSPAGDDLADDIVDALREPELVDSADTQVIQVPALAVAARPSTRRGRIGRLRRSASAQLTLLAFAGVLVFVASLAFDDSATETARLPVPASRGFPTLDVEGAPRVTVAEVERRLRAARRDTEVQSVDTATTVLRNAASVRREPPGMEPMRVSAAEGAPHRPASLRDVDGVPSKDRTVGRWFSPGGMVAVEGASEQEKPNRLPLGVGERLFAKLEVGVSSSHRAAVLARLTRAVEVGGRVVAPVGAIVKGRFRSDGRRVFVDFTELLFSTGRVRFEGYAIEGRVPGLVAVVHESRGRDGAAAVAREAVGVARDVVRSVTGGSVAGRLADGVADGVSNEAQSTDRGVVLEVPAGRRFEIVVTTGADE